MDTKQHLLNAAISETPKPREYPNWNRASPDIDNVLDWMMTYMENTDDLTYWCAHEIMRMDYKQFRDEIEHQKLKMRLYQLALVLVIAILAMVIASVAVIGIAVSHKAF